MPDEIKMLPVKLDSLEKAQRATELAETLHEIETREERETERKKLEKDAIEALRGRASALGAIVRTGTEQRPVMTATHDNTTRWTIDFVRLDTGEVYYSRPMSSTEREKAAQLGLWVESKTEPAPTEAGRNDNLPVAADAPKPKRREPKTKAEALVANQGEASSGWEQG